VGLFFIFFQAGTSGNISFVLMVNKQGQTRLASYYDWLSVPQRVQVCACADGQSKGARATGGRRLSQDAAL
jgi:hypothetical protein